MTLDILDAQGKVVRHLSSKEKKKNDQPPEWPDQVERRRQFPPHEGMNRFAWDLRYDDPVANPGRVLFRRRPARAARVAGRLPGEADRCRQDPDRAAPLVMDPRVKDASRCMLEAVRAFMRKCANRIARTAPGDQ